MTIIAVGAYFICNSFILTNGILDFIVKGFICVGLSVGMLMVVNIGSDRMRYFTGILKNKIFKRKKEEPTA